MNLTEEAYLIAWDGKRGRMRGGSEHAGMIAAAMLIELHHQGIIRDDGKHPARAGSRRPDGPGRAALLHRIAHERPRRWRYWVSSMGRPSRNAVRDQLAKDLVIKVEKRTLVGIPIPPKVTVRDPRVVGDLVRRVRSAALGNESVTHVSQHDAALAALAAAAELGSVLSIRERWQARARIAELTERAGPAAKAFKSNVQASHSAAA